MFKKEKEDKYFGIKKGGIFFSNSVEVLFEHLKVTLFSVDQDIFSERLLLVPSLGMQQWIHMQLASFFSISCGFTATFLNKGMGLLCEKLFYPQKDRFLPSQLELFLRIEHEISQILSLPDPIWQPLVTYVQGKEARLISLARHLAKLFEKYGIYANGASVDWERKPSNWQEALWAKIFRDWDYPQRTLSVLRRKPHVPSDLTVHLFAFSHLSSLHFSFFCQISNDIPVYLYQLSPCQEFWSDLPLDHPTLLGSMGKVGREMAKLIEASDTDADFAYVVFGGQTQLRQLQRSLLTLQELTTTYEDDSVQVHAALTPHQEIENLYRILHSMFSKGEIEPKDVIVMAPQITHYAPYIQSVFNRIPYQIADMPVQAKDRLVSGLFLLLELEKKRWCAPAVLALFSHSLFRKKQGFSEEECLQISTWVQKIGIYWAVDSNHRDKLLKKSHCRKALFDETATWMQGLGYLIEELALSSEQPLVSFSQAELLGTVIQLIQTLHSDLGELEVTKTLIEWVAYFRKLSTSYFALEDAETFFSALEKIEKAAEHFAETKYSFSFAYALLNETIGYESETVNRHLVQAVRFCSMLPMRAIPAKVICLLGMNHAAFPRKDELTTLDLLRQHPKADYSPSRIDFDRYVFLEALLSAREKLIVSYIGKDPFDLTELAPSSVLAELFAYIPKNQVKVQAGYDVSKISIKPYAHFTIKVTPQLELPKGEFHIDVEDLARFVRSPLRHYLYLQGLKIADKESYSPDEPFVLSPLKNAILKKEALFCGYEAALKKGIKVGAFPIGLLGTLAREQLKEETVFFPEKKLKKCELKPIAFSINASLTVLLTGALEGIFENGICVPDKFSLKNSIKYWPHFLMLNTSDASKKELFFAVSNEKKLAFFEDPAPFLQRLVENFFYAKEVPLYFSLDWIEPILAKDPQKLLQAPIYDSLLKWQMRGKDRMDAEAIIEAYLPILENLYLEMANAWK
jgi:exodeoxyribonuclease V gamma subunit